jgi:hypothetical protein
MISRTRIAIAAVALASTFALPAHSLADVTTGVSGTVVDATTSAPLGGVEVDALAADSSVAASATTDGSGSFAIDLAPGSYALRYAPPADSAYAGAYYHDEPDASGADQVTVDDGAVTSLLSQDLHAGEIDGRAQNSQSGNAIQGLCVVATRADDTSQSFSAQTGPDGRFAIAPLESGGYTLDFKSCDSGSNWVETARGGPVSVTAGQATDSGNQDVDPGATIAGRVVGAGGGGQVGLGGVCVATMPGSPVYPLETKTDAGGNFSFSRLPHSPLGQPYELEFGPVGQCSGNPAYAHEYYLNKPDPSQASVISLGTGQQLQLPQSQLLQPAGDVFGQVFDAAGNPVPRVCVAIEMPSAADPDFGDVIQATRTAGDGSFSFRSLVPTSFSYEVEYLNEAPCGGAANPGYFYDAQASLASAARVTLTPGQNTLDLHLPAGAVIPPSPSGTGGPGPGTTGGGPTGSDGSLTGGGASTVPRRAPAIVVPSVVRARVSSSGGVSLPGARVSCVPGVRRCRLTSTLTATILSSLAARGNGKEKLTVELAGQSVLMAAGSEARVNVRLRRSGLRTLLQLGKLRATLRLRLTQGSRVAATRTIRLTLLAPKRGTRPAS